MLRPKRFRSWAIVIVALGVVLLVAATEYLVFASSLSFFYIVPISLVTWFVNRRAGALLAAASVMAGLATDLLGAYQGANPIAPYVIAASRCGLYLIVTVILTTIKQALARAKELAGTDPLTGLANARLFHELANAELNRARRYKYPVTFAYIDIDNFKTVNDRFGHSTGDALLREVARTIDSNLRAVDMIARLGGDEFAILLPEADAETAPSVLHKLRQELLNTMARNQWPVTFSIGLMTFLSPPASVEEMIQLTDGLMYQVKHSMKNRVKHEVWTAGLPLLNDSGPTAPPTIPPRSFGPRMRPTVLPLNVFRRRIWLLEAAGLVLLTILAVGTITAVADSLPGSSLYALKREAEIPQLVFARSPEELVRVHLLLADRRLSEMTALLGVAQHNEVAQTALAYEREVETMLEAIHLQPAAIPLPLLRQVGEHLLDQQSTLRGLEAQLSPADRPLIEHSLVTNQMARVQLEAIAAAAVLAKVNPNPPPTAGGPTPAATATAVTVPGLVPTVTGTAPFTGTAVETPSVTSIPSSAQTPPATNVAVPTATADMTALPVLSTTPDQSRSATGTPRSGATAIPSSTTLPADTPIPPATATLVPLVLSATPTPVVIYRTASATASPAATATPNAIPAIFRDKILFMSDRDGHPAVYVMDPDGSHLGMLTNRWAYDAAAFEQTLGANGALRVFVLGNLNIGTKIAVTGPSSQQPNVVFENNAINYDPTFAPDGYNIAYISIVSGADEIYQINRDRRGFAQLTTGSTWQWNKKPSWSSDGSHIIWWSNRVTGRKQIWIMNADGSNVRNLSNNEFNDWDPVWVR